LFGRGFGLGFGWEEAVVVGGDAGADGFAESVLAEGFFEFGLGEVNGLEEGLREVGYGAGGAGFDVAADYGGD
jgi:hypothetical protein